MGSGSLDAGLSRLDVRTCISRPGRAKALQRFSICFRQGLFNFDGFLLQYLGDLTAPRPQSENRVWLHSIVS